MDNFILNEFNNFDPDFLKEKNDSDNNYNNNEEIDEEWINNFFGRRPRLMRKNFQSHLDDKFLESCPNHQVLFDKLKISSSDILSQIEDRYICENCFRSRRYFCYKCFTISPLLKNKLPTIPTLPIKIDIIKHHKEVDGKSTSPHAKILAPKDVRIFIYPNLPEDWPNNGVFLIFPEKKSPTVEEFFREFYENKKENGRTEGDQISTTNANFDDKLIDYNGGHFDKFPIKRIVFIDSTWRQTRTILNDNRLKKLPTIMINSQETMFWRYHKRRPSHYLSTIEAIYYFLVQMHQTLYNLSLKTTSKTTTTDMMATSSMAAESTIENIDEDDKTSGEKAKAVHINSDDYDGEDDADGSFPERNKKLDNFHNVVASSLAPTWYAMVSSPYQGQYDNLLFFFKHTYYLIKNRYHL